MWSLKESRYGSMTAVAHDACGGAEALLVVDAVGEDRMGKACLVCSGCKDCATACSGFCIGCSGCCSSSSASCTDCSDAAASLQAPVQAVRVERRPLCIGAECVPAPTARQTSCRKRAHRREMRPSAAGHLREAILWQCLCSDSCIGCSGPHLVSVCTFSPAAGAAKKDCATACSGFCIGCSGCFSSCSAYCTDCSDAAAAAGHLREAIPWQRFVRAAALAVRDR